MNFTVIFDFDGTLADTFEIGMGIYNNHLAGKYGLPKDITEPLTKIEHRSTSEVIKQYLRWWNIPVIGFVWEKYSFDYIPDAKLFPGIAELVLELKNRGFRVGILSSNIHRNVVKCLENNNLNVFDFIKTNSPLGFKTRALNKIFRQGLANKDRVIYIGDEVKDIRSCRGAKIPVISVSWGLNHKDSLIDEKPDFFVNNVDELSKLLLDDFPLIQAS